MEQAPSTTSGRAVLAEQRLDGYTATPPMSPGEEDGPEAYALPLVSLFDQMERKLGHPTARAEAQAIITALSSKYGLEANIYPEWLSTQFNLLAPAAPVMSMRAAPQFHAIAKNSIMAVSNSIDIALPPNVSHLSPEVRDKSVCIYYGSYTKTCENLAKQLSHEATSHGLNVIECGTLDSAVGRLAKDVTIIIITSTIGGQPPPNARKFVTWIRELDGEPMKGVKYALFGSGSGISQREQSGDYQRIPIEINKTLAKLGATRLHDRGEGNAEGSVRRDFAKWKADTFWPHFGIEAPLFSSTVKLDVIEKKVNPDFKYSLRTAKVESNKLLSRDKPVTEDTNPDAPIAGKHSIVINLPSGMTYQAGDYLSVMPVNPKENVKRALERFKIASNQVFTITDGGLTIPKGENISPWGVLSRYVELGRVALPTDVEFIASFADEETQAALKPLAKTEPDETGVSPYEAKVFKQRLSPLDILERYPSIDMPISAFLSILPPMELRQYSISSSSLADASKVQLTYTVVSGKHTSGVGDFHGVSSTYLSRLRKGYDLEVGIVSTEHFRLPVDIENTPVIMICAGTGLSPFRSFVQERAIRKEKTPSLNLAPALLFVGCKGWEPPNGDRLYPEEFEQWEEDGIVQMRYAYSRPADKTQRMYVQHKVAACHEEVKELLEKGANVYVCASKAVGRDVKTEVAKIWAEVKDVGAEGVGGAMEKRMFEDVFG